jgi:hypothetical protein
VKVKFIAISKPIVPKWVSKTPAAIEMENYAKTSSRLPNNDDCFSVSPAFAMHCWLQ